MGLRILTVCLALIEDISEKEKFEQLLAVQGFDVLLCIQTAA